MTTLGSRILTAKILKLPPMKMKHILKFEREVKAIRLRLTLAIIEDILSS